ncbi:MAG: hypothetical protein A2V87_01875 [Deltaproteobacteria bacterium RBG_16_58_17]|nr:MAG: hypothetical protein A2V87_01875 [Deltaproteobacteria bacterium RBG_16_58_17]
MILDTNVVISGIFFAGPPYQMLKAWREGKLIVSGDKHLLKASGFRGIKVLTPREFVNTYFLHP